MFFLIKFLKSCKVLLSNIMLKMVLDNMIMK